MDVPSSTTGVRFRRLLGLVLVIAAPAVTFGVWYRTRDSIATLAALEAHRVPGDTTGLASAAYHAGHARTTEANRWRPTGYATLGLVNTIFGIALLASGRTRRTA